MFNFNLVDGIIFDLDDTLVKTTLDFATIKQEIGCTPTDDILSFIDKIECSEQRKRCNQIVLNHEMQDALSSEWIPGAEKFVAQAISVGLPVAIVTRNCREATDIKISTNNIPIDFVITREDAPAKPDPSALNRIANFWEIESQRIAYIGDYIYDIQAAHNANMQAWLFESKHQQDNLLTSPSFDEQLRLILK